MVDRIAWTGPQNADDFAYLKSLTSRTPKITLPGPCYIHYRAGRANISRDVYPDLDSFWSDLVEAYAQEMQSLADAGCTYLQLDETSLVKLGDPRARELLKERGDDWRDLLKTYIGVVNAVVAGAPRGMTVGIHICRSQDPSWQANVGYDPIAEAMFNDMKVGIYFLEYDNARAGGFEPLRRGAAGQGRGARARRLEGERAGIRRPAQAADRGGQPPHQARPACAVPAMRVLHQRHRTHRRERRDAEGQARAHRRGGARGLGKRIDTLEGSMPTQSLRHLTLFIALALSAAAAAQPIANFYQGKTVTIFVGFGPGGGYDAYAQLLAQHIRRHIPGEPTVIVKHMPGAGSLVLMNHLFNVAPRDGTTFGIPAANSAFSPLTGSAQERAAAKFDATKFSWLGSLEQFTPIGIAWHTTGIRTLEDAKTREMRYGSGGSASGGEIYAQMLNEMVGTKFRPVRGYRGSNDYTLALSAARSTASSAGAGPA